MLYRNSSKMDKNLHFCDFYNSHLKFHHTQTEVSVMDYISRAKNQIADSDIKQKKLAEIFHISEGALSNYLTGRSEMPVDILVKIAKYFDLSMDYLVGLSDEPHPNMTLTKNEQNMVNQFRQLNQDQRELILQALNLMQEQNKR